ncbi:hypothetical protein NK214_05585 [Chromobacterium sp. S0633]|uniref:hypothetical protein n=1 Tax=Chromobacterium sp. S0633 TaxID=2957805 RepID=UPI00209CAC59|nr:hypothetical protein [Chromobacterium sp. S0633]MCP1289658.1 hypothetical protein [Chromobacterium sp. S0633]
MPITLNPMSALPQCEGEQWIVNAPDQLAHLVALVLVGQAFHAGLILEGTQLGAPKITANLKETLDKDLHPTTDKGIEHRDGLLFEIICWIAARKGKTGDEKIDSSHLKSTNQGTDGVKVTVNPATKTLTKATVYEYKCTIHARQKFQSQVLKSFREYISGERDNQLAQAVLALLENFGFTGIQLKAAYDTLIQTRPLAFEASLTVSPSVFPEAKCIALFKDYDSLSVESDMRGGNTLPLDDVRAWFADFADRVWGQIEKFDV